MVSDGQSEGDKHTVCGQSLTSRRHADLGEARVKGQGRPVEQLLSGSLSMRRCVCLG